MTSPPPLPAFEAPLPADARNALLAIKLAKLEQALAQECELVWNLSLEIVADRDQLESGFLAAAEALLLNNRRQYHRLIGKLLVCELDTTRLLPCLQELDDLIGGFRQIVAALNP